MRVGASGIPALLRIGRRRRRLSDGQLAPSGLRLFVTVSNGTLGIGDVFHDMTAAPGEDAIDAEGANLGAPVVA